MHKVIFLSLSIVLACFMLEAGLRIFKSELTNLEMIPVHWLLTNPDWTIDPDVIYAEKSVLLDIEKTATHSSAVPLIVTLGDSFTAGEPFRGEKSYPSQLQRSLAREAIDTEVLNVGSSGYNPDQELLLLQKILEKGIRPKIVVWSFYINDFYESGQWPNFSIDESGQLARLNGADSFIFQRQEFFNAIPLPQAIKEKSALVAALMHFFNLRINHDVPTAFRDPNTNFAWVEQKFHLEIQAAKKLAEAHDFELVFVSIYPQTAYFSPDFLQEHQILDDNKEIAALNKLLSKEKYYIPLQFNTLLEGGVYSVGPRQCVDGAMHYFIRHGSEEEDFPLGQHHFNPYGYFLFGEVVKETIKPLLISQ